MLKIEEYGLAAPTRRRLLQGALGLAAGCTAVGMPQLARAEPALRTLSPLATMGEGYSESWFSVSTLSVSPDGKMMLISHSWEGTATLWDLTTREEIRDLRSERIAAADFLSDGRRAMIASRSNKVELWDVVDARVISTIAADGDEIETAAVSPDDRLVAVSQEEQLSLWDLRSGARMAVRNEPDLGLLMRLAFAPNGKWLACVYRDEVRAYDVASLRPIATWRVQSADGGMAWSQDSRFIVFGDGEQVRILDVVGKREAGRIDQLGPERSFFLGMATFRNGLFAVGDNYGHLLIGSIARPGFIARSADPAVKPSRIAIARDQKYAYVGTQNGQVVVFDVSALTSARSV